MDIKEKFIELTKRTYPHGTEQDLYHFFPDKIQTDEFGNKYIWVGQGSSTMFTCHLDTASSGVVDVVHRFEKNIITTDGRTILGADDKAGMTILLFMIEQKIPGLYYFFLGEERGCVGSRKLASKHKREPINGITKVISFDRRGVDSIITHQMGGRCCSEVFGTALAESLNGSDSSFSYQTDPTGIYTDSAQFTEIYQECTNVSVGYNYEHTHHEEQDIDHLEKLCKAVVKVDWENLPVNRNVSQNDFYEEEDDYYVPTTRVTNKNSWTIEHYFVDTDFSKESCSVKINKYTNSPVEFQLSDERLEYEMDIIQDLLETLDIDYKDLNWDGNQLIVKYENGQITKTGRSEMAEYLIDLDFWKGLVSIK